MLLLGYCFDMKAIQQKLLQKWTKRDLSNVARNPNSAIKNPQF